MIQEKYNRRIYDEGTAEAIFNLSHLRCNALEPVGITAEDSVLIFDPKSTSITEWLEERAKRVTVIRDDLSNISDSFDIIISIGTIIETPSQLKELLKDGGRLVFILSDQTTSPAFLKKLLRESGFADLNMFILKPDYIFTTEIYSEDYIKGGAGDYLLIAR